MDEPGKEPPVGRLAAVLGGGVLRGMAHIGALRAMEERGWVPDAVAGSSIGALIGAAWATGFSVHELEAMALSLLRTDIFRIAHGDMALLRMRSPGIYLARPLEELLQGVVGDVTFRDLPRRLVVSAVEINSGQQVYWGLPGLDDVRVADAIMASCAMPGFFPPREIRGGWWVDGGIGDNLPVRAVAAGMDGIIAVDVGARDAIRADVQEAGFASVVARAGEIVFQRSTESFLAGWRTPPLLLVRPRVEEVPPFSFRHTPVLIAAGYRAALEAIDGAGGLIRRGVPGIHPRRWLRVEVDRERCVGCGVCVALAPAGTLRMDADGRAAADGRVALWSPLETGFVRHCPTLAIRVMPSAPPPGADASTADGSRGTAPASA